jgi:hypothetical protein
MVRVLLVSCASAAEVEATAVVRRAARLQTCGPIGGVRNGWGLSASRFCTALPSAAHPPVHGVRVNGASNRDRFAMLRHADAPRVSLGDQLQPRQSPGAAFDCAKIGVLLLREVRPP